MNLSAETIVRIMTRAVRNAAPDMPLAALCWAAEFAITNTLTREDETILLLALSAEKARLLRAEREAS